MLHYNFTSQGLSLLLLDLTSNLLFAINREEACRTRLRSQALGSIIMSGREGRIRAEPSSPKYTALQRTNEGSEGRARKEYTVL